MEVIQVKIVPIREIYYNDSTSWGIYACNADDKDVQKVKLNRYGNITICGVMPRLELGTQYNGRFVEKVHKQYGHQYEVQSIVHNIPLDDPQEQRKYLQAILTPYQFQLLWSNLGGKDIIGMFQRDEVDIEAIKGMGEITYKRIKEKIVANLSLQRALTELAEFGLTYKTIKKLIDHFNGSPDLVVQKVKENPYILCKVTGFGFKTVDAYALNMGIPKDSPHRIESAVLYILQEQANSKGHCWITKEQLLNEAVELTLLPNDIIEQHLPQFKDVHIQENMIGLAKYHYYEKKIYEKLNQLLQAEPKVKVENVQKKIDEAELEQGFKYTEEQRKAIELFSQENVMVLNGYAGTGKSTSLRGIYRLYNDCSTIAMCALSGKAAQRIAETTGSDEASTIHRLLGWNKETNTFQHNAENPLNVDIVIVDEMSMVDTYIFYSLLMAIPKGAKLLLVGDLQQLPPVGVGAPFRDIIESGVVPQVTLSKVMRQAEKSGILSIANGVRKGRQFIDQDFTGIKFFGEDKSLMFIGRQSSERILEDIKEICSHWKGDLFDIQVVVPMKERGLLSVKNLNKELQNIFNPAIEGASEIKRGDTVFRVGDKVAQFGNNYEHCVWNGSQGIITDIYINKDKKEVSIQFEDVFVTYSTADELAQIDLAYACTVHRYQGSGCKNVILALDYSSYMMLSRQLLYTGLTRAIKKCFLIAQSKAVAHSVRHSVDNTRNTFLQLFYSDNR